MNSPTLNHRSSPSQTRRRPDRHEYCRGDCPVCGECLTCGSCVCDNDEPYTCLTKPFSSPLSKGPLHP